MDRSQRTGSLDSLAEFGSQQNLVNHSLSLDREHMESPAPLDFNGYGNIHNPFDRQTISQLMGNPSHGGYGSGQGGLSNYPDLPYSLQAHSPTGYGANHSGGFRMETSPIGSYPLGGDSGSPGWINMNSPPPQYQTHIPQNTYHQQLRYPVLNPLYRTWAA